MRRTRAPRITQGRPTQIWPTPNVTYMPWNLLLAGGWKLLVVKRYKHSPTESAQKQRGMEFP